jgi:hypothetical protein
MNTLKLIVAMVLITITTQKINAQDTLGAKKIQMEAGFTLVPQGTIDLTKPNGFKFVNNLFAGVTTIYGNWFNTSFYSLSFNSYGTAIGYSPTKNFTAYAVYSKNTTVSKTNYVGLGIGTPLAGERATGFIECGSSTYIWKPGLYMGMFIPFTVKIR